MDEFLNSLRAVSESTRIRVLNALSCGEFNVSELTEILDQSQPRVSRHLKLMAEAGLITRHKEGNWVLFRLNDIGHGGIIAQAIITMLPPYGADFSEDNKRIEIIKTKRQQQALNYFNQNAGNWQKLRSLHIDDAQVETRILQLAQNIPHKSIVDLGTGTGRMIELLAPHAETALGFDTSKEMLALARATTSQQGLKQAQIRQGDLYDLPLTPAMADLVIVHQVLHYLDQPEAALTEAERILTDKGHILIVDFSPHALETLQTEHAHRRLGISSENMKIWAMKARLKITHHETLPPPPHAATEGLTVSIWLLAKTAADDRHTNFTSLSKKVN